MMGNLIDWVDVQIAWLPALGQLLVWALLLFLLATVIYLLFSLLLAPFMLLYNRLTDKNKSNVLANDDYVLGELTEKIHGTAIGEVMEIGSGEARSVHPARLYNEAEAHNGLLLPVGTKVLIIDFDDRGVALVVQSKSFIAD